MQGTAGFMSMMRNEVSSARGNETGFTNGDLINLQVTGRVKVVKY